MIEHHLPLNSRGSQSHIYQDIMIQWVPIHHKKSVHTKWLENLSNKVIEGARLRGIPTISVLTCSAQINPSQFREVDIFSPAGCGAAVSFCMTGWITTVEVHLCSLGQMQSLPSHSFHHHLNPFFYVMLFLFGQTWNWCKGSPNKLTLVLKGLRKTP